MKIKKVYQVEAESYEEEQALVAIIPESIWINLGNRSIFLVSKMSIDKVLKLQNGE